MAWRIVLTVTAREQLAAITDRRVRQAIARRIDRLAHDPERQGKPLLGDLAGYHSTRAAGQRYRIIYQIATDAVIVYILALGIRREGDRSDIYTLARRLFRQGLLAPATRDSAGAPPRDEPPERS